MSWLRDSSLNCFQNLALQVLKSGSVPEHIAFIMDGNRRFASKTKVAKAEGHSKGFDKLAEVLKWCFDLGVLEVTVYAFSIENFKRSKDEVDALLELATQKFEKLIEEKEKLMKEGVNIRVIGDLSLLPQNLCKLIGEAVCMTKENTRARLNVAFAYTARNEITESVRSVVKGIEEERLDIEDLSAGLLEKAMYTEDSLVPDLLIRTSGEVRLSDFMLWQSSFSCIYFTPVLWPEFSIWELLRGVFHYQRSIETLRKVKSNQSSSFVNNPRVEKFLSDLYASRLGKLETFASG